MLPREVPLGLLQPFGGTSRVLSQPLEVGCTLARVRYVYSSETLCSGLLSGRFRWILLRVIQLYLKQLPKPPAIPSRALFQAPLP